mgnify:CR=1 FL=1
MFKKDLLRIFRTLNSLGALTGTKFVYAVSKNINLLKNEVESLEKASAAKEDFVSFEKARVALAKEHAKKDDEKKEVEDLVNQKIKESLSVTHED